MAEKLDTAFSGCSVHVGSPRYWREDWDVRTSFAGKGPPGVELPDYPDVGLHQPPEVKSVVGQTALRRQWALSPP